MPDLPMSDGLFNRRALIACLYAVGIAAAIVRLIQYWVHVPQYLPYLIILACPLMHLFMHRGHSGHHSGNHHALRQQRDRPES
jgi:hypothetical protein